jgi:hypothetical protein
MTSIGATLGAPANIYDLRNLGAEIFEPVGVSVPLGFQSSRDLPGGPSYAGNETDYFKSGITRLDSASSAEKSTFKWAYARATLEVLYHTKYADDVNKDAPRENLDSTEPVVKVIVAALEKQKSDLEAAGGQQSALSAADQYLPLQSFEDLKKQSWFKDFASQLDAALQSSASANSEPASASATNVTLSAQAKAALSSQANAAANYYAQFFPTRDGTSATALGLAVTNPGAVSSSAGKPLAQVADDARASLDAKYAQFNASGSPFDINSFEGKDWYSLVGDLDRRSLYAISSNQGGRFSDDEQKVAQSVLGQEERLAAGFYAGPTRLASAYVAPAGLTSASLDPLDPNANATRQKALAKYLDGVSDDEKSSVSWAYSRASAQVSYETITQGQGQGPNNLESQNPVAKLIADALKTQKANLHRGTTHGTIKNADDLKSQPWFQGFGTALDALLAQNKPATRSGIDITA